MDSDLSCPFQKRVKRELPPDLPPNPDAVSPKRQAGEHHGVASEPPKFPWTTCDNKGELERLKIKEDAVKIAEENCTKVRKALESTIRKIQKDARSNNSAAIGQAMIQQWLEEHDQLRDKDQNLEILVGVEGPTGAGKSSLLASLLRIPDLFPSGHTGATTACVGKVSWNWDSDYESPFRAKITFRKKADIEATLESLLRDFQCLSDLPAELDHDDSEEETIMQYRVGHEMTMVECVWALTKEDVQRAVKERTDRHSFRGVVQWILARNPEALRYLQDGVEEFRESKKEKLRQKVTPFLTSKVAKHGTGRRFAVWPLVEDVHMYVKSDILKSGMTLVDLPGCGDSAASRSQVARKFSHRLDVRIVVSPISRAAHEKNTQELMQSGFDEAQMKIRGKYDGHGFGIILSHADILDFKSYITGSDKLGEDSQIIEKLKDLEALRGKRAELEKSIKKLERGTEKANAESEKSQRAYSKAMKKMNTNTGDKPDPNHIEKLQQRITHSSEVHEKGKRKLEKTQARALRVEQEKFNVDNWLHEIAYQDRNRVVQQKIQANYAARQKELNQTSREGAIPPRRTHSVPIFPVNAMAFWRFEDSPDRKSPMVGYTTRLSTGIPAVEKWLHEATLSKREKHLDEMLGGYQSLLDSMKIYSQEKGQDANFGITSTSVKNVLDPVHREFSISLCMQLTTASMNIDSLNPLANRVMAANGFRQEAYDIATKWRFIDPNNRRKDKMMHWKTYEANMARGGGEYTPRSNPGMTYTWMKDLAAPMLRLISSDWDEAMNHELMEIQQPITEAFEKEWQGYQEKLRKAIRNNLPALELSFNSLFLIMANSERVSRNKVHQILDDLSKISSGVNFDAAEFLTRRMEPTFATGLQISLKAKRLHHVESAVKTNSMTICDPMLNSLENKLKARTRKAQGQLTHIAHEAIDGVKRQVSHLLDNLMNNYPVDNGLRETKIELQKEVRALLDEWEQHWRQQEANSEQATRSSLNIPEGEGEDEDANQEDDADEDEEDLEALFEDDEIA
ncbi:hypothetical protein FSARC_14330 [Fusarium sarcochroum]|uniref:Dynamin N-terminal domain-containing protein n=1 Tax=Fusarium sarcochroum TaxID=1208366 RepID=A0A8H4WPX3_9HYPO|nr:hypothetical protein FSARC_14330 [Fusarium sarcochroum]